MVVMMMMLMMMVVMMVVVVVVAGNVRSVAFDAPCFPKTRDSVLVHPDLGLWEVAVVSGEGLKTAGTAFAQTVQSVV